MACKGASRALQALPFDQCQRNGPPRPARPVPWPHRELERRLEPHGAFPWRAVAGGVVGVGGECPMEVHAAVSSAQRAPNTTSPSTPPRHGSCKECGRVPWGNPCTNAAPALQAVLMRAPFDLRAQVLPAPLDTTFAGGPAVLYAVHPATCVCAYAAVACVDCACHARALVRCARCLLLLPCMQMPPPGSPGSIEGAVWHSINPTFVGTLEAASRHA